MRRLLVVLLATGVFAAGVAVAQTRGPVPAPDDRQRHQFFWWWGNDSNQTPMAVPSGVWTPLPFQSPAVDPYHIHGGLKAATTIADDELDALPTNEITLVDASGFSTGRNYLLVKGPPGENVYTIIGCAAREGNTLTRCNEAMDAGISVGQLAPGQPVTAPNVLIDGNRLDPYLWNVIAQAKFAPNPEGVRAIRYRNAKTPGLVAATSSFVPGVPDLAQEVQVTLQPNAGRQAGRNRIEIFQNSGAPLNEVMDGIDTPTLMGAWMSDAVLNRRGSPIPR